MCFLYVIVIHTHPRGNPDIKTQQMPQSANLYKIKSWALYPLSCGIKYLHMHFALCLQVAYACPLLVILFAISTKKTVFNINKKSVESLAVFYPNKISLFEWNSHNQIKLSTALLHWGQITEEEMKSLWDIGLTRKNIWSNCRHHCAVWCLQLYMSNQISDLRLSLIWSCKENVFPFLSSQFHFPYLLSWHFLLTLPLIHFLVYFSPYFFFS